MEENVIKDMIKKHDIYAVDFRYNDLVGAQRHVTVNSGYFEKALHNGVGIDGSSVKGFSSADFSDLRLKACIDTAFYDPIHKGILAVFADVYLASQERQWEDYPRVVLEKALSYVREKEIADNVLALGELEFYIFDRAVFNNDFFSIGLVENAYREGSYHIAEPNDRFFDLREQMVRAIESSGIGVKYHHHEVGANAQQEIEIDFVNLLKAADSVETAKYVIKEIARQNGLFATFMPRPIYEEPGNGMHFHIFIEKGGKNEFYMENGKLNDTTLYFIGGILAHARSLSAFVNPSTNSYKRLMSGYEAPSAIVYSIGSRISAIRIPGYDRSRSIDIEYRPPDATMNTYLGLAAILMAGVDGIERKINPGKPATFDTNSQNEYKTLPETLGEALSALIDDNAYLKKGNVFTDSLLEKWIDIKEEELKSIALSPNIEEYRRYF